MLASMVGTMVAALSSKKLLVTVCMQVSVLDGNKYTTMCREAGEQCLEILEECTVHFIHATLQMAASFLYRTPRLAMMHDHLRSPMMSNVPELHRS